MELTEKARAAYTEMVSLIEKEVAELGHGPGGAGGGPGGSTGGIPQIYAHMGHSRTPSACSAISFSSSILSEPISENYPHSEPETDSRGYEIVKVATKDAITRSDANNKMMINGVGVVAHAHARMENGTGSDLVLSAGDANAAVRGMTNGTLDLETPDGVSLAPFSSAKHLNEIDEGNEADTEDVVEVGHRRTRSRSNSNERSRRSNRSSAASRDSDDSSDDSDDSDADEKGDTVAQLPLSVQSSLVDLNAENLSQHSCKTVDLSASAGEALSTHSSHTLAETANSKLGNASSDMGQSTTPGSREGGANTPKLRPIDKEKMIESWVVEATQQMERLKVRSEAK